MKKCPNCEKTFDDNLKFCQTDGTPLVAVEEEKPEDPYKTTVSNASDLPIPPFDPLKTIVASPIPPPRAEEPKPEIKEDVAEAKEEEIDPMKTLVATDFPPFKREPKPETKQESKWDAPPSPFDNAPKSESSGDISAVPPDPPKFSEPNLNPPSFGETPPKSDLPVESPSAPPIGTPSEPLSPPPSQSKPFEMSQPQSRKSGDFSGDSPYNDAKNAPIPSPFDLSMPPGYQIPSAPMPTYKEAEIEEIKAEALNTPFAEEVRENQQIEQQEPQGWTPPPAPNADWQNQQIGQNTPFEPPAAGLTGQNKTLAIASLICGVVSLLSLVGSIIPFIGLICGGLSLLLAIGAIITGYLGRSKAKSNPAEYGGAGFALGGIITGALTLLGMVAMLILAVAVIGIVNLS